MEGGLSAAAILDAWEAGTGRRPLDQAIACLRAAGLKGDLAGLPLAERDRRLLELRRATFGDRLELVAACPACGTRLELELRPSALAASLRAPDPELVEADGARVVLRSIDSRDLAAAADARPEAAMQLLRARLTGTDALPAALAGRIDAIIEAREEAAEIRVSLACLECGAAWTEALDVAAEVWAEIEGAALRLLGEVAELAAAFGWSEPAILALSDARRDFYLDLWRGS
jgi:hypothetical protein